MPNENKIGFAISALIDAHLETLSLVLQLVKSRPNPVLTEEETKHFNAALASVKKTVETLKS